MIRIIFNLQARALGVPTTKRKAKKKKTLGKRVDNFVRRLRDYYGMSTDAMDSFCSVIEDLKNKKNKLSVIDGLRRAKVVLLLECDTTHTRWFVDTFAIEPTLADDKYYVADRHHLNDAGHALLGKVLGPIVVKIARAAHRSSSWW